MLLKIMQGNVNMILFSSSKHEWTTWAACGQIFEVIQKIKEGEPWKAAAKGESVEDALKEDL